MYRFPFLKLFIYAKSNAILIKQEAALFCEF